jgi:hypothetical protein
MGCVVNGPGEAREADLGVASGNGKGQIFVKGEVIKTVPESQIVETLIEEALRLAEAYDGPSGVPAVARQLTGSRLGRCESGRAEDPVLRTCGAASSTARPRRGAAPCWTATPVADVFVASRIEPPGSRERARGARCGASASAGPLESLCYSGANLVPVQAGPEACARSPSGPVVRAAGARPSSGAPSRAAAVAPARAALGPGPRGAAAQPLLALAGPPAGRPDPSSGGSGPDELEVLLPACVAMFTEEIGVSPTVGDGGALYRARVQELIAQGRAFARIEGGRVLFKAEVGAATARVCQVQGVWVAPELRGQGLSVAGTAAVVELARRHVAPVVSLYVNDFNTRPAGRTRGWASRRSGPSPASCSDGPTLRRPNAFGHALGEPYDERSTVTLQLKPGTAWEDVYARARAAAPEALRGRPHPQPHRWGRAAHRLAVRARQPRRRGSRSRGRRGCRTTRPPRPCASPSASTGRGAGRPRRAQAAGSPPRCRAARAPDTSRCCWCGDRQAVGSCACADVDRALDGVDWYPRADRAAAGRGARPHPRSVSNIASWNYPMSVQVHAELVQCLAGNGVVAKTPVAGRLPHPHARARVHEAGRPAGDAAVRRRRALGDALISSPEIGALAFVGGRANGRKAATTLADTGKRHLLEQEGLNVWGVWDYSDWDALART